MLLSLRSQLRIQNYFQNDSLWTPKIESKSTRRPPKSSPKSVPKLVTFLCWFWTPIGPTIDLKKCYKRTSNSTPRNRSKINPPNISFRRGRGNTSSDLYPLLTPKLTWYCLPRPPKMLIFYGFYKGFCICAPFTAKPIYDPNCLPKCFFLGAQNQAKSQNMP